MSLKRNKTDQEVLNPCLREQNITFKCFNDNNYDKEKCTKYMENYKYCKKFWAYVRSERKRAGIVPHLPLIEEREEVKNYYMKTFKF